MHQNGQGIEGPGDGGMRRAESATPAGPALPCRNSNNYPKQVRKKGYVLRSTAVRFEGPVGHATQVTATADGPLTENGLDASGAHWIRLNDGETWERISGGISSAESKRAFSLRINVEAFFEHYGRDTSGFLTFSPNGEAAANPQELARRFNDARKHNLSWLRSYVRVLEPRRDGSAHHHLCVATPFKFEPDKFDWEAFRIAQEQAPRPSRGQPAGPQFTEMKRRYAETAPTALRECWSELRSVCKHHGLGRSELLPLRKSAGAVAHYVGAYLGGGLNFRRNAWKGASDESSTTVPRA